MFNPYNSINSSYLSTSAQCYDGNNNASCTHFTSNDINKYSSNVFHGQKGNCVKYIPLAGTHEVQLPDNPAHNPADSIVPVTVSTILDHVSEYKKINIETHNKSNTKTYQKQRDYLIKYIVDGLHKGLFPSQIASRKKFIEGTIKSNDDYSPEFKKFLIDLAAGIDPNFPQFVDLSLLGKKPPPNLPAGVPWPPT